VRAPALVNAPSIPYACAMIRHPHLISTVLKDPLGFLWRVAAGFRRNQGLLLSGAIAYYTLLSIVPLFILFLVLLSGFVNRTELLSSTAAYLNLLVPGQTDYLMKQVELFVSHKHVIGVVGVGMLLLFSSWAFTALENAMSVIFYHRVAVRRRHFLVSAVIPYLYILLLGFGLLVVSFISGALQDFGGHTVTVLGESWSLRGVSGVLLYLLGVVGEILLLTSLYMVMPVGRLAFRHALVGGVVAGLLWEATRHVLVWYFSTLSMVNALYGALGSAILILISFEAAAVIVLLGAQLIAEYERGLPGDDEPGLTT